MSAEMVIEGKTYVPSKDAAKQTGYTQDYVGQLCRGGSIDARRIGGLWYVNLDSLSEYKTKAEAYTPAPPQREEKEEVDSFVSFEGKDYVSTNRGAEITGYAPDYVGQLAREGRISARQVGTRWYVAREELVAHKKEKDALLGAVQADAVGLVRNSRTQTSSIQAPNTTLVEPVFTYIREDGALVPPLYPSESGDQYEKEEKLEDQTGKSEFIEEDTETYIPIRVMSARKAPERQNISRIDDDRPEVLNVWPKSPKKLILPIAGIFVTVLVLVGGVTVLPLLTPIGENNSNRSNGSFTASVAAVFSSIGAAIEQFVSHELRYIRSKK